jgi:hypothetical protein
VVVDVHHPAERLVVGASRVPSAVTPAPLTTTSRRGSAATRRARSVLAGGVGEVRGPPRVAAPGDGRLAIEADRAVAGGRQQPQQRGTDVAGGAGDQGGGREASSAASDPAVVRGPLTSRSPGGGPRAGTGRRPRRRWRTAGRGRPPSARRWPAPGGSAGSRPAPVRTGPAAGGTAGAAHPVSSQAGTGTYRLPSNAAMSRRVSTPSPARLNVPAIRSPPRAGSPRRRRRRARTRTARRCRAGPARPGPRTAR